MEYKPEQSVWDCVIFVSKGTMYCIPYALYILWVNIADPCESIPCQHKGICTAFKGKSGFKCTCDERHNGTFCENSKFEVAILDIKCLI